MSEDAKQPKAYEVYQHYKGGRYLCLGVFIHTETKEPMVAYRELCVVDAETWVRPLYMWYEKVSSDERNYCGPRFVRLRKT